MTKALIITRGLPGSGKSTYARVAQAVDPDNTVIVNRDSTRARLFGSTDQDYYACGKDVLWRKEKLVTEANHAAIKAGLKADMAVIVDDTNLRVRTCRELRSLANREGAEFHVVDFSDVPLETCLERNRNRKDKDPIPPKVIADMYDRYIRGGLALLPEDDDMGKVGDYGVEPYVREIRLQNAYIFDIDGTLAIHGDRSPYDLTRVKEDELNEPVAEVAQTLHSTGNKVIIMSGRSIECLKDTRDWLYDKGVPCDYLYMRVEDDKRQDWKVKYDLFNEHVRGKFNVLGVFDDRISVLKLWEEMGLTTFRVGGLNGGNF